MFVSKDGNRSSNITNGSVFNPTQDGWIRISVFDNGTHDSCCLRFFQSVDGTNWGSATDQLWGGTPLYRFGAFNNIGSGSIIVADGATRTVSKSSSNGAYIMYKEDGIVKGDKIRLKGENGISISNVYVSNTGLNTITFEGTSYNHYLIAGGINDTSNQPTTKDQDTYLILTNDDSQQSKVLLSGVNIDISSDANGKVTLSSAPHNDKIFVGGSTATDNAAVNWNNNGSHYILHSSNTTSKISLSGINIKFKTDSNGTLTLSGMAGGGGAGLGAPDYSKLVYSGDPGYYTPGQGHTFIIPSPKNKSFYLKVSGYQNGRVFGVWAPLLGSSTASVSVPLADDDTDPDPTTMTEDGWIRVTVIDDGNDPNKCVKIVIDGNQIPIYKFLAGGGSMSYPQYNLLYEDNFGNPNGLGNSWILPLKAGFYYKIYSTAGDGTVYSTFVTDGGSRSSTITNGTIFQVRQNGWVRVSVFDNGNHNSHCLRIYQSTDGDNWGSGTPLYKFTQFGSGGTPVTVPALSSYMVVRNDTASVNTSHTSSTGNTNTYVALIDTDGSNVRRSTIRFTGDGGTKVSSSNGVITISSSTGSTGSDDGNSVTMLYAGTGTTKSNDNVTTNGNVKLKLFDDDTNRANIGFTGSGGTSVTCNGGTVTISSHVNPFPAPPNDGNVYVLTGMTLNNVTTYGWASTTPCSEES